MTGLIVLDGSTNSPSIDAHALVTQDGPATQALSWQWTSWDGTVWNLTDLGSPVLKLKGATGTGLVDPEHVWFDAAALPGSTWQDARDPRGSVFLPLLVSGNDSLDFLANHSAFKRSLNPRQTGTLRVTRPDGQWREIDCRYESGGDSPIELDPVMACRATYGITWATPDPYWRGEPVEPNVYTFGPQVPWLVPPGPPVYLNPAGDRLDTSNPGDVDVYPVWRVNGPFTSFTVGIGDSLVSATLKKVAGQWVEIDTTPGQATILDSDGDDQWLATTRRQFAAIPPGKGIPVVATVLGSGSGTSVTLSLTPKYRDGW